MLESLVNFDEVNDKPYLMCIWAFVLCSIAILIANQVSYRIDISGVVFNLGDVFAVLFAVIPSVYFITLLIKQEEKLEEEEIKNTRRKHSGREMKNTF